MADLAKDLAEASAHAAPAWTPERERAVRAGVERAIVVRARRRGAALALVTLLVVAGGVFALTRPTGLDRMVPSSAPARVEAAPLLRLADGSTVTQVAPGTAVEPVSVSPTEVAIRLDAGSARFSVTPNPARTFRVLARGATITVLGTVFTVALESGSVRVGVERGRVHVAWPGGERELGVGEAARFEGATPQPGIVAGPALEVDAEAKGSAAPPSAAAPSWRALAQDGDYAAAFARMTAEGPRAVKDEPADLLLAADVARLGGHPDRAVASLERVVTRHSGDSRAPLAAFTLGRTLLDQLGRPREAAQAFANARKLAPRGALAQDALAREVESWARAGEASLAREKAIEYVTKYPKGRRLAAVKRLGEIE